MPGIDPSRPFEPPSIAVLTVSDTRELADDKSGATVVERLEKAGHRLAARAIVKGDVRALAPACEGARISRHAIQFRRFDERAGSAAVAVAGICRRRAAPPGAFAHPALGHVDALVMYRDL